MSSSLTVSSTVLNHPVLCFSFCVSRPWLPEPTSVTLAWIQVFPGSPGATPTPPMCASLRSCVCVDGAGETSAGAQPLQGDSTISTLFLTVLSFNSFLLFLLSGTVPSNTKTGDPSLRDTQMTPRDWESLSGKRAFFLVISAGRLPVSHWCPCFPKAFP